MGYNSWNPTDYQLKSRTYQSQTREEKFSLKSANPNYLPTKVRESRDSDLHPESNAIMLMLDVTGSMGMIPDALLTNHLGKLFDGLSIIPHPQLLVGAIGDSAWDQAPIQVGQFETDITVTKDFENLWLEGGGGGNGFESYDLAWLFAGTMTSIDCYEKRQKKGYLFTVGDEAFPTLTSKSGIPSEATTSLQALSQAQEMYHVFHLSIMQGYYYQRHSLHVDKSWEPLGKRHIKVKDYSKLVDVILATIALNEGFEVPEATIKEYFG